MDNRQKHRKGQKTFRFSQISDHWQLLYQCQKYFRVFKLKGKRQTYAHQLKCFAVATAFVFTTLEIFKIERQTTRMQKHPVSVKFFGYFSCLVCHRSFLEPLNCKEKLVKCNKEENRQSSLHQLVILRSLRGFLELLRASTTSFVASKA